MKNLFFAACCFLSVTAFAEPRAYQIEVIVFSHLTSEGLDAEEWPLISPKLNFAAESAPLLLSADKFKMTGLVRELQKDPHYQVLSHIAWRESLAELDKTQTIHLYGGQAFNEKGEKLSGFVSDQSIACDRAQAWQVNGLLSVSLDHFFNFGLNLYFAEPTDRLNDISKNGYFAHASDGLFYFHLQENRRSKSGELNYFDYPIAGALIEVFPS